MPEYLRALIVILFLASVVFVFAKVPACAVASAASDYERRRNLWFAITLVAFFAHNYWIYVVVAAAILLMAVPRESNRLAMYFLLLFAVPSIAQQIPGMGIVRYFFTINYVRLLSLAILLPAFLSLLGREDTERFGRTLTDKLIVAYLVLIFVLQLRVDTFTNSLRHGVLYAFLDVFLPYYVASRSMRDVRAFRDAMMAFVVAALVLSLIATFEFAKHWLLYGSLDEALGLHWGYGSYLERAGTLRAQGSTGQPIALGYVAAVAIGFLLFLRRSVSTSSSWTLALALLGAGLLASLSRGPWAGAGVMVLAFIAMGPAAGVQLAKLGLLGAFAVPALLISPFGEKIVKLLPFVGTVDQFNVTYRERLLELTVQVIMQNPFFGSPAGAYHSDLESLRQGEGIIDIVNTYLGVGLASGLVGLSLFSGFFVAVAVMTYRGMRSLTDKKDELHLLGRALLSTLFGIMVIIFTVSSITVIPVVYWSVAGLGVAYAGMLSRERVPGIGRRMRTPTTAIRAAER
ncbi:MAG TPA: O-antigen ligase family protein [Burkholderiales bacterium]|nr:O-antigen ligase family protein [Burkholderiales bacterium]